ncbi:uncharacterized protein LOC144148417 isoform X5 [Haemaphysalis longicornis]
MGPGEPTTGQNRDTWIALLVRYLASHRDQCDPSLYLFIRWLTILLFRAILSQMTPSATDGNASFLRAARAGNLEKVLDYLKGSIDINTSNANGLNALHLAAKEGHVNVVNELLKRGANVNATTKKGNSALHIASLAGQEEVVKLLVQKQANVNVQSQNGFTPLYMAAQENHDGVVRFLLANGANQSLATEDGFTPLAVALQQGHDKVVAVLLENDARGKVRLPALHIASKKDDCKAAALLLHSEHNPDVTSKSGFTPLHIAAHYGNSNIASLLLEKGADVNFPAKHQITPLHVAAKWGKSNMVKLLLEKGAKMDASTRDGLTPLHCAARSGHDQVVEQLLEKNAPITAKTKNGLAPLHMASQGDHVDSARILLYHKAPVDDVTVDYLTALHVAAHCGHVGVAKLLLDRRADPNARALNGFTPLHIACKKNRIKVVELLLKHGASIEATTESGLTPLHVASFMGCMNIVIYLIQHGANPDIPTVRGETPLHLAARANQTDIIRILLRNGAHVDAKARELQTALHIASRLGNADMVGLLLQHGAAVDAPTKDAYTPLHVAAREGQDEVAALLLDHGAALAAPTKKGFTPLHLAAKYGNLKVAQLLLQKDAPVDAQGKNGVTPLHVAAHYDHVNVALLLLEKGASPHSAARNGYTPLHVAARKDQMDIASSLLEYGAKPGAESRAGFTPLHLAAQEGHADLAALLVEHGADCDAKAKNGLTPMHLCAQEDRVEVATILAKHGASLDPTTKAGYTPLHVACHFGQTNMIRFLLRQGANVNATTSHGYTPLHQAAQQGHTLIINLLLEHRAAPNAITNQGQTALAIAQRLGYISVVETLKVVTETIVTTTTTTVTEEKYRVVAPETMHETFMSDSEDEAAEDNMLGDQSFRYLTADEMKSLGDDSLPIDVTRDERITESIHITREPGHAAPLTQEEERLSPTQAHTTEAVFVGNYAPDNVDLSRTPIHAGSLLSWDGDSCSSAYVLSPTKRMWRESSKLKWKTFLVSFLVDARGGAMRGCRHSGVRVIIPPRKAQMPMRITCRYLRKEKLPHPPPLLEGEACASRILEVGPAGAKFLGPVILEVPHFASLRGKEREISILRSDNGETWKEHTLEASEEAVQEVLNESFEGEELSALEDLQTNRIVRILTTDFPQYFAVVSRTRQEVHAVGPEGGLLSSTVVPQVQAIFPEGALTKKIRVGLQAQPIPAELVTKLLGHRVAVSPIVTVEPRRRKFHKPITLTIPVPQAATKGMINQYAGDAPTLRLLCSITGGTNKAQWEDVTGSTPLTFVNDCVSFTTTVSARFWLMDCRQVSEATKFATELYAEAMHVPFMAKFVVFAKRLDPMEAQLRVFCMTDDKEDKTLESQEHFTEVAKSRDVEVLEKKSQYLEFGGNLVPVTKSGEQLQLQFQAFRENRLPFAVRVKDPHQEPLGRLAFMRQPRAARASEPPQAPLCNLNIALPEYEASQNLSELVTLEKKYGFVEETGLAKPELIHRADLRLSDIARELGSDWAALAAQLDVPEQDVASIRTECPSDLAQQALLMLRLWMKRAGGRATGNNLEKGLRMINREDIVNKCMFNVELVTDDVEKAVAKVHLDQSGFDTFREELGTPKDTSLKRDASLDVSYDEQDLMKEAESAEETSSETGSVHERHTGSEAKGTSKTIPGVRKGSPISPTVGRIVRGSSKEKTAPQMAVEETFEEEPVVKSESAEATQQAASGAGPTAPPRDAKRKSKKEKTAPGPDYSLPRIRDTPERAFESATDATAVSSVRESTSRESTPEGKAKKKKEKKEKSPSPPGPDYTLPRLRDLYTPPRDVPLTSGPPEEDLSEASLARKSKERSLSPGSLRTAENGSLGTEPLEEREAKREPRGSEDTIVEKVERVVKETPGKIVEMVHIKRQRSSKSPEGKGTPKDKKKKGFPSSDVDTPDAAGESKDVPSDSTEAKKKQKMEKESSPTKHRSKDVKEVPVDVDKEGEFSAPDGKSPDSSFLSKMAKKMFPRGGRASASDEEPSSFSESSPVSKKKAGKLPKSATLPKASEKSSKMPTHGIKSVDVEVDASKLALKGTKDVPAMDADDLETSTGDVVKDSDGRFFSKMAKIPKRMFPRSSKTSSSEDEPSSASESISAAKQKGKKEPKGEISSKKKDKSLKIKQPDSKTLSGSFAVGVDKDRSSPGKEDVDAKGHDREKSPGAKLGLKIGSIEKSLPHVKVGGSVERPEGKTLDIKPLHKEPQLSDERELSGKLSSDIELSLSSKEPTVDLPEATEESFDIGTPEHGKSSKGGFMHKMAKLPRKMFSHGFKGDASVEEPSAGHEGKSVSGPELEFKLDAKASDMKGPDGVPAKEITTSQPGTIDIKAPQSDVHLKMKGKIPEKPGAKVDIAFPTKKLAVGVPYGAEKHEYQVDQAEIRASFPDRPEAGVEIPGKQISVDFPEGRDEKIEISGQGIGKPSDVGFMSKVAKLPKKMLSYGSKEDGSADEEPGAVGDVHFKMPQGHIKVDVKGSEKPDLKGDIEVPGKKATVGMPEGIEGRVELSAPEVAKPSDGGFMSKMAKLPKKMFPHGSKGGVSVEGEAGIAGDVHVKMPEAHLQVGAEGLEKPEAELDIALPKKKVGVDLPDVDGKVEISGPEFSKSPDGGFISKMAKLPKKMFPHGTKDVSVEGEPGDIHIKMPEAHLKVGIEGLEKPEGEVDIALPEKQIDVDLPEGVEGKFEVSGPEFGRSSDGGFISKMANLPKKMFPHGTKDVSVEKGPEVGDIHVEMPEARLKVDVEGLKKPEIDVELPKKKVGVDLPEEVEGKVVISGPDFDKSSDGGFMSKMAKLPKKMFSHGAKDVSVERGPEVGDIHIKMPEAGLKVDVEGFEKPEIDVDLSRKKVGVDLPEGVEGKVEMSGPEFDKLSDGTFMSKMAKFPKKMFPHGSKDVSLEGEPEVGDIHVKMPEAHLKVGVEGLKKPEADVDIALPQKEIDVDLPEGVEGKIDISGPEFGKSSDGGFISKMAKLPKKMFPHGSKGGVSVEGEAGIAGDVHVKMPEAHLQVGAEGLEKPEAELDIALPKKKVGVDLPDVDGKVEISGPEFSKSPDGGFISKMAKLPKKMFPHGTKDVSVEGEPGDIHVKMPEAHLKVGIEGLEKPEGEVDIALPEKQIDVDLPEGVEGKFEVSAQGVGKPSDTGFMSKMTKFPKKMFPHGTKGVSVEEEHEVDGIQVKMPEAHLKVGVKGLEKPEAEVDVTLPKKKVGVDIPEGVEGKVELPAPQVGKSSDKGFMSKMAKLPKKMFPHGSKGVSVEEEHKVGSVHVKTPEAHLKMGAKGLEKPEAELDVTLPKKKVGVDLPEGVEGKVELTAPEVPKQSDKGFMSKMKKMFPHSPKGVSGDKELEVGDVQAKMPEAHLKVGVKGFGKPEVRGGIPSPKKKVSVDLPEPVDGKVELSAPELGKSLEGGITSKMAKVPKKKFPLGSKGVASIEGAPGDVHVKIPEAHLMSDVSGMEKPEAEVDISFSDQKVDVDLPGSIEGKVELTAPEVGKPSDGGFMSKMAKLPKKMFPHGSKGGISVEEVPEVGGVHVEMPEAHLKLGVKGLEKPETEVDISIPDEKVDVDFPGGFEGKVELTGPEVGKQPDGGFMSKMAKIPKKMFPHGPKGGVSVEGELEVGDVQGSVPEAHLKMGVGGLEKPQADVDIALPKEEVEVGLPEGVGGKVELSAPELGKSVEGGFMSKMAKFPKKMFPHGSKGGVSVEEAPGGVGDVNVKMPEAHLKLGAKGPEKPDTEVDITLPDKKIDVDLPGEFEGKVELTAPEIGKPSDGGFMSKMAKLPKKMFPHGSKGGISVEEELQGVGDANVKMPEAHLKLDVAGVEKPEAEVGISLPDQKIDVDLPGGIEGEVQLKASEVGKSVDGKIASKMAKLPKKMFSHASKEEPLGDAHIKVPEAQLKFDVKGPEKPGAEVDISLPDKKVDVELPGGIEGKVEITAPEVGKSDKGFMSKMAKFPKKMFSHGSKGGSSVEEAPDGVGDVHVKIPEAHLKLDVKGLEKPEPELEKVDADFPGGIEGKVEFTSPEVGKSSDKGFMSKMAKLPKKMFPHGSKGGVSIAETSGGFGDLDVEMPEAHLKVDVKGPEKPEAHLDASLPDQKVDVGAPEGIGGKVELSAPEVGKPSDSGFMAKVAKLPKKMFPHGTKGSISVEEGAEITGDVHVEMPGARLNVEGLQKPDAEVDISLPEERLAVGLPEGVEGKVEVSAPEVGKSSPADFLSKMAKVPKKMFPLGSGGLSVEEESRVGDIHLEMPEAHLKASVEGLEKPGVEVDVAFPEKKGELPKGIQGKVEVSAPEVDKPSDGGFMSKMTKKIFSHGSKGGVSVEETSGVIGDVGIKMPEAHVKLDVKGLEKPETEAELSVRADFPGGPKGKGDMPAAKIGKPSDGALMSAETKLPEGALPDGHKAGGSIEGTLVTGKDFGADIPGVLKVEATAPKMRQVHVEFSRPIKEAAIERPDDVAAEVEMGTREAGKAPDKGFISKMAKLPKKMFHHGSKGGTSTDEHSEPAEGIDVKTPELSLKLQTEVKVPHKPEDVSVSLHGKEVTVQLPEESERTVELSTRELVGVPDKPSADILPAGTELPITARRETKETPGGVIEVVEVTTHEVSKPASPGLLSKVSKIPKKIFPRGSKSKGSDEESPSAAKRELRETPGGLVEVVEVTKHDVTRHPESKHSPHDDATGAAVEPAMLRAEPGSLMQSPPTLEEREIREVPGGVVEVVRVTKHIVGRLPEDKHADTLGAVPLGTPLSLEAELAKDPSAVVKREVKETPEGHVEVVQVIRREVGDVPFGDDFPGDRESGGTISRRIETTVVEGKPTVIRRLVTTTADGVQHVTENIEQGAEDVGSVASSLFAKMGDFAKGLSSGDSSAVTTREVKQLPGGGIEVVSITKQSSSSPERGISSTQQLPGDASELPSSTGSMHFAESAAGQPMEAKTTIIRREISGPETVVRTTTSIVTSATAPGSSKPDLSADDLDKMFGDMEPPKVDERLKDVLTGGYRAKREVTPEEAELLAQLFPEQSSETASYPPAGLVPEAAIIPEYRGMTTAEGAPPQDPESKEKVLLKLGRALSQDDLDAPSPTRGEAAMAVAGLGEAVDTSDQVEEPVVEKLELARRESKRLSQEFEQDEPLPKAMAFKSKPSEETVVSSTQVKGVHDDGTVKHTVTTVTKTTIIQEMEEPAGAPRPGESETWASDLDTSQVSVSSLPEDERTEPTLSSSATTATAEAEALSGPLARTQVEEKEWTETDPDSGEVRHIISKTTHTTVTSVRPTEGAPRGDTMSSSVSRSSKDDHRGSAASAPSDHDEAESLTFFQKKEFFEKLSEQSPPQEALSASRLGSTPSLDTALTRPAVSVKPRPRSESLTSQGEIVEESIVFAERLRLFQGGTQASSGPSAGFPQLDDLAEQQPHQGTEEKGQVAPDPSQPRRLEESQDLEGKGGTRLLVHTSDADKEALDVCSVQVSEDARDQQFSRMRVRVPALEESVAPTESPQPKVSPLRDAYKDSLLTAQQESGQAERDAAVVESSHAPSAAADPATSAVRSAGGRERSPLLEASPPEETAYRPEQDVSPAQEYPEYLSPDMQVRVGVSPTEVQPVKEKPARYSESSMESSSEVGSPCPQSQGGTAMAFENVAFAGEDVIDATSSPVEESSSPAGSRSPYEVVRDARTEEATSVALMEAEKSLQHAVREETFARPQSLVSEERSDQPELQITTKIFAFDQSPGVCAPEKKELSEGLLGVGLLTVSDMTARTPESRRGDSDEDEEEWADHVMSKIRGRPVPPTPPASPRTVQSAVEVQGEQVTWEAPVEQQEGVQTEVACDIEAEEPAVIEQGESGDTDVTESATGTQEVRQTTTSGKRPQLEHIPSEISDEDLVEREQSPTHVTATCRGDRKDSSSDRNSSPDSDGPRASGSHRRTASGVGTSVFEASSSHESGGNGKQSHESHDKGTQEDDKIAEEPEDTMFVIEEEMPMGTNRSELSWGDTNEKTVGITGGLSPGFDSPPKTHDGSSSGKLDAASPVVLRSKSKRTEKRSEKRSSRDMDTGHSGSETDHSHYYSFEMTSDSGKTPGASRPTSSEFDLNVLSGQASSEYETCATSQDGEVSGSYATAAASSHDTSFATARSSLSGSSRGSAYSVDSESSGHLGSMEVSEASETIVASAHEELDSDNESERSKSVLREPYDGEIPESVIRGGVEHPFLPSWQSASKDPTAHGSISPRPSTSGGAYGPFQTSALMEPGHSYTGWTPVGSSAASGDPSRGAPRAEVLNGASASPEGQERRPRPGDDHMASSHEEEQLSVSESSATQSEHTWQTSVETMVDAVEAQHFSCDSERHHHRQSTMQNLASLPLDQTAVVEGAGNGHSAVNDSATPPFQEVNGPVEVEYVPEYDDLAAGGPVRQQDTPEGQAEPQVVEAVVEAAGGDAPASHELDEQENSTELREEGFYAEIFQGDLSSEEVESAANEALLLGGRYHHERTMCNVGDEISPGESFERPVTPEPVVTMDAPSGTDHHADHSAVTSVFEHAGSKKSPTLVEKDTTDSDPENEPRECAQGSKDLHTFQDHPRSESASSSPETATADDIKLYTSKCEDYILQMHQTYRYGVGLPKSSDEHFLPEEGMDVENVKLLEGRLQEGSGSQQDGSQQDFPYDLSYEQEYAGDVRVEHGDLYTHQEVEEEAYDDERTRLRARRRLSPISDERGSTPDYDTLAGRKMFGKSSEKDDASTSSLMEFERLEAEMASGTKSSSVGSSDSFSGRQQQGRNGTCSEQDSVSLNSLTEFERLEKELVEAEGVDTRLRGEVVARLDEIDEGHESQASDPGHEATVYNEDGVVLLRQAPPSDFHASEEDQEGGKTVNALSEENQSAQELEVGWSRTERHFLTTRTESGHSVDSVDRQSSASTATQFDTDSLRDREIDDSESNFCPDTPGWTQKECTDLDSLHDSLHDAEHHDSLQEVLSKENDSLQLRDPSGDPDSLQDDRNELQDSLYEAQDIELDSVRAEETSAADGTSNIWQQFPSQIRTTELSPTLSRPASSPLVVPVVVERIDTLTWVDQDSTRVFVSDGESLTRPQEHPCNDTLVSSTDSLEPTSSANTHATYQCDTDSMMSSLNSAEESTMVSSTDTLDHETLHFTTQGKTFSLEGGLLVEDDLTKEFFNPDTTDTPRQNKRISLEGRVSADDIEERFRECLLRSAVSPTDEEQVEECQTIDEKGNLIVTRTVKRHVTSEPQLHTQTFAGPDAEQQSREFVASFAAMEPSSEKDEYEGFDTAGNAVRVTQHVLVRPTVKTVTFTGPDARLQMREYMRSLAGGQHSSAENTPTSDSGVGACSSLASPQPLAPDPPAAAPTSACPGLQRLSGGDHWVEAESAMGDSSQPATATRMITTRTTRTVGPDGREQLVTTTTTSCEEGGDEPETRLRRSMQGVLDSFMAEPPPSRPDEE